MRSTQLDEPNMVKTRGQLNVGSTYIWNNAFVNERLRIKIEAEPYQSDSGNWNVLISENDGLIYTMTLTALGIEPHRRADGSESGWNDSSYLLLN